MEKKCKTVFNTILYHFQLSNTRRPRISAALTGVNTALKVLKKNILINVMEK